LKIKGLCDNIDSYSNSRPPFWAKMPTGTSWLCLILSVSQVSTIFDLMPWIIQQQ
jgi:hypothetical protein